MNWNKILIECENRHISVNALEKMCGFSHGAIAKWHTTKPRAESLYKVAQILGKPMEYFMEDNDDATDS